MRGTCKVREAIGRRHCYFIFYRERADFNAGYPNDTRLTAGSAAQTAQVSLRRE